MIKFVSRTTFRYVQQRQDSPGGGGHFHSKVIETRQLCCKGIKARPDVFWDLNITFKYFVCLKKSKSVAMYLF